MIDLVRDGAVFVLTMTAGENCWTTQFTRAMAAALDTVEASEGPAALVTASADPKFFSNGLDLDWLSAEGSHAGGDRAVFGKEFMTLMARIITFPIPTVAAVGGHGFGAGCMLALCHDLRVMREDRGYLCANEIELGMSIPDPELALSVISSQPLCFTKLWCSLGAGRVPPPGMPVSCSTWRRRMMWCRSRRAAPVNWPDSVRIGLPWRS